MRPGLEVHIACGSVEKKSSSMDDMDEDDGDDIVKDMRTKLTNCSGGAHVRGLPGAAHVTVLCTWTALFTNTPIFRGTP